MLNLYQLKDQYLQLYNEFINSIDNETGEVDIDIATKLSEVQTSLEQKALNVAYVYRMLEDDTERITQEINRLQTLKKRLEGRKAQVKVYLSTSLLQANIDKINSDYANISFRNSEQTIVDNESFLDSDLFITKIERKPDLKAIKQAIKEAEAKGDVFVGAHIETKQNIQIK